jgi:capsular polysaccharide transport system permease protein
MTDTRDHARRPLERKEPTLLENLAVQLRVIGAIIMRELHTRYGRDNIGYLWLFAEPLIYGGAISVIHGLQAHGSAHGDINPIALGMTGYSVFIIWRGIVGRADGALAANLSLLQHRMVTILDLTLARSLLELAGCFSAFLILGIIMYALGIMELPERPLYVVLGVFYVFWLSAALGMIITGLSYERPVIERLVHPATYFSMPLSGAFIMMQWLPSSARSVILWFPLPHAFEIVRYGMFANCTLEYVDFQYLALSSLILTIIGLVSLDTVKNRLGG